MISKTVEENLNRPNEDGFIFPDYNQYCFSNIPSATLSLFGIPQKENPLSNLLKTAEVHSKNSKKIILLLIDGFGYYQWLKYYSKYEFLNRITQNGLVAPITTVFPSTTAATLTTIHSGLTPQEHGLPEWWIYFEEIDKMIATLPFTAIGKTGPDQLLEAGVDPKILFDGKTFYQTLNKANIPSYTFIRGTYSHSTYSSLVHKGSNTIPYINASDLLTNLREKLSEATSPSYFYVYWDTVDTIAHRYGPHSEPYFAELNSFTYLLQKEFLEKVDPRLASETTLFITADHGFLNVDPQETVYLNKYPEVVENFSQNEKGEKILPWGSPRDLFLSIREDKQDETLKWLKQTLKGKAKVLKTEEGIDQGLFGKGFHHAQFDNRIGNILILPFKNNTIWYEHIKGKKFGLKGAHGGLTPEEMLVPFAIANLSGLL